ncbi:UNVERIFIED_CONTAM: hypothetical protein Scaly_0186200 [Sesamum calycinum]|uniref:MULE transposase domain-containing protein n=1 Tax=Sesamum calycinum TaxID=2727403 RepID=A0AAW2SYA3_9LAMI
MSFRDPKFNDFPPPDYREIGWEVENNENAIELNENNGDSGDSENCLDGDYDLGREEVDTENNRIDEDDDLFNNHVDGEESEEAKGGDEKGSEEDLSDNSKGFSDSDNFDSDKASDDENGPKYPSFNSIDTYNPQFQLGCRPIVGVDGCQLKGPHGGVLLTAVGIDPNNACYPIAFAVVSVENRDAWEWFLRFCVRHLHGNMKRAGFTGLVYKKALWMAARATTTAEFDVMMKQICVLLICRDTHAQATSSSILCNKFTLFLISENSSSILFNLRRSPEVESLDAIFSKIEADFGWN